MRKLLAFSFLAVAAVSAQAQTLVLWNFNSSLTAPSSGVNLASGIVTRLGGTTVTSVSGTGSSDAAATNNAANYTTFPAQGAGNRTAGVQYTGSIANRTAGNNYIEFNLDARWSGTASKNFTIQYYTDSNPAIVSIGTLTGPGATTFKNGNSYIVPVASLGSATTITFRVVSNFAPGTTSYTPDGAGSTYGPGGTFRNDVVQIRAVPVPEPASMAVLALGLVGLKRRRKSA